MTANHLRVAVTGANGYVGSSIASFIRQQGADVIEFNRRGSSTINETVIPFQLGSTLESETFNGIDVLIHCAYDFAPIRWADLKHINVDGSLLLLDAAHQAGTRIIFISTISAFDGCKSLYGQAKLAVERIVQGWDNSYVVRPGLVYESGNPRGIVGTLSNLLSISPMVPLINFGRQPLYPCYCSDLAQLVYKLCTYSRQIKESITAASGRPISLKTLLQKMARAKHRRVVFIPIPSGIILFALKIFEAVGGKSRLRSDSLLSILNTNPAPNFSSLLELEMTFQEFDL